MSSRAKARQVNSEANLAGKYSLKILPATTPAVEGNDAWCSRAKLLSNPVAGAHGP
ncbi:unannotated protein [freshwater metagenome]|uniref:Unannotated protein n=1 Tax=freshwater metagenome TaxID=449393 RepID=A0A6J6F9L2_9ZZZZ